MATDPQPTAAASKDNRRPGHFSRHAVGYATVLSAMLSPIGLRLADPAPIGKRALAEMIIASLAAGCAAVIAYWTVAGGGGKMSSPAPAPPVN